MTRPMTSLETGLFQSKLYSKKERKETGNKKEKRNNYTEK
jgi:hypothetical protein